MDLENTKCRQWSTSNVKKKKSTSSMNDGLRQTLLYGKIN